MPASIFSLGNAVKILKDLLRFKSGQEVHTNVTDATIAGAGYAAPTGTYLITTSGRTYYKYGAGDTDWNPTVVSVGVAGGQSISGGTASGNDLTLDSTTNATKGRILTNSPINLGTSVSSPSYAEGNIRWNTSEKTIDVQTGLGNTTLQIGQEFYIYVYNNSGAQIDDGKPVYISGVNSGVPTIALANAHIEEKSKCIGLATHNIANGAYGFISRQGLVRDIDTSGISTGRVYLDTTDGVLTNTRTNDGSYVVEIGQCLVSDAANGIIFVNPMASELTVEVTDTNGFPPDQKTATTLAFVDGTRTFTIAPTGSEFHFYELGAKYEKTSSESVVIDNTEGIHFIYYNSGTLTALANPTSTQIESIILNNAFVAYIYWDAANSSSLNFIGEERHGISMSPKTHIYLHETRGAQYISGLGLADILADENGSLDSHAQFSSASGTFYDEDIDNNPVAVVSTAGLPIYYLSGASAYLRRITETGFSVVKDTTAGVGATGRLVYNQFTGGAWQLTTVGSGNYVLCHVFAANGYPGKDQTIAIIGQNEYSTGPAARTGAETEISNLLVSLPLKELVPIGTVIFQTNTSYANSINARIISTDGGNDYVDWRTTDLAQGAAPTNHNNLSGLELANTGNTWGHIDDQTQTIYGAKTFNSQMIQTSGFDCQGLPVFDQENNSTATGANATLTKPTKAYVRLTNASLTSVDDIANGDNEQFLVLTNDTGSSITINNSATKIVTGTGSNLTLADDASLVLYFDSSSTWRVVGGSGSGSSPLTGTGTSDPTVNTDSSAGYSINSLFTNTSSKESFICQSASVGAAVWRSITSTEQSKLVCAYKISGTTSIPNTTVTQVPWVTAIKDNLGVMSSNVITIPAGYTGKYVLTASIGYASDNWSGKYADVIFTINDTETHKFRHTFGANSITPSTMSATTLLSLSAGDTVEVETYHNLGSAVNISGATFNHMSLLKVNDSTSTSLICAYKHAASTSIANTTQVTVPYDTAISDTRGAMSSGVFTVPSGFAGYYLVSAAVGYASAAWGTKYTDAVIQVNSTDTYKFRSSHSATINVSSVASLALLDLSVADTVLVKAFHNLGSSATLQGADYNNVCIQKIDTSIPNTLACAYTNAAFDTINQTTETLIDWDTSVVDTQSIMSSGVMTIPSGYDGDYILSASVGYESAGWTGYYVDVIYKINDTETHRFRCPQGGTANVSAIGNAVVVSLSATDTVKIYTYHNITSSKNLQGSEWCQVTLVSVDAL